MSVRRVLIALTAAVFSAADTHAGEIIRFEAGSRQDVALPGVPLKALVSEFLDPSDTGAGKSVGYLVWREIFTAISDQAGAGVILAKAPGDQRLTDLLEKAYHEAAVSIARQQEASMVIWGAVITDSDKLYVSAYLSVLPEAAKMELKMRLVGDPPLPQGLEAEITRTNFNFPLIETSRSQLFERCIVTRAQARLRTSPDGGAPQIAQIPTGRALNAVDMINGWFKVRLDDGRLGYVDNSVVHVPPRVVEAHDPAASLKEDASQPSARTVSLDGEYLVRNMRDLSGVRWYEIQVGNIRGWVPATKVQARFSMPVVHFAAGLYRYQARRYEDADREFGQYASAPSSPEDNPTLATAYELQGASRLLSKSALGSDDGPAVGLFSKAIAATPFDPTAYSLRALSNLAVYRRAQPALADLEDALRLDATNAWALRITRTLQDQSAKPGAGNLNLRDWQMPAIQQKLQELAKRYPAEPPR